MPVAFIDHRRSIPASQIKFLNSKSNKIGKRPKSCYAPVSGNTTDHDPYTSIRKIFYEFPKKDFYGHQDIDNQTFVELTASSAYSESVTLDTLTESAKPATNGETSWMIVKSRLVSLKSLSVPNYAALETPKYTDKHNSKNLDNLAVSMNNLAEEAKVVENAGTTRSSCTNERSVQTVSNCACTLASSVHDKKARQKVTLTNCPINQLSVATSIPEPRRVVTETPISTQRTTSIVERSRCADRKVDASVHAPRGMCADGSDWTLAAEKSRKLCQCRRSGTETSDRDNRASNMQDSDRKSRCPDRHKHAVGRVAIAAPPPSFAPSTSGATEGCRESNVKTCGRQQECPSGVKSRDLEARFLTGVDDGIISTSASSYETTCGLLFIPWSKRATLTHYNPFARKQKARLSSMRPTRSRTSSASDALGLPASYACSSSGRSMAGAGNQRSLSSNISHRKLRRHKSDSDTLRRPRTSSNAQAVTPNVIASGFIKGSTDAPKVLLRRRTCKMQARLFFSSFSDKLRDETFALDFPGSSKGDLETLDDTDAIGNNVVEALCGRLLGSTYKRLFHIRCRLSEYGRQSEFSCDGIFGCDENLESIQATQAHWV